MKTGITSRSAVLPRRAWPALLTLVALACVTPPAPADASQPTTSTGATESEAGSAVEQKPAPAQAATPPTASPPTTPPAPATTTAESTPATTSPAPAPATASAESPCDTDWVDGQTRYIVLGERADDGKPLEHFRPSDPMYPYDLRGDRFLFGDKGSIYTAVGRFEDREDGKAALQQVERERPSSRAVLTTLGPYLVPESPTCRPSRVARGKNPAIDSASWIVAKEGVLLLGSQSPCKNGTLTKKVTVLSCDGMKTLMTDSVQHVCDHDRHVDTCVYSLEPGIVFIKHAYTLNGVTSIQARALDVRTKKQVFKQKLTNGSGLAGEDTDNTPETDFVDVDGDGIPEQVVSLPDTGKRTSVRKWHQGKFVETRSP
ncbi:hypothetical protein JY651_21080 [Pyxidicoccus parkwayensis]|uniref:Lipoprotein n=1 Tax=Pyxidicoccus parkwayensis TaxID=2813578 RepID=A0ABX7PA04_9BACT|nr:hypothetical protein [Pyxidicoccus parkwaysis]QSQ27253.1 hypothetical protein JY651_21080 [Pyxidicoccus parkwaysis]